MRTDAMRQDIDATRESMTDKIGQIESKVKGTVDDLKGSVEHTVENVKENVKQAFDVQQQVNERPWLMLGASVVTGYVLGSLGGSDEQPTHYRSSGASEPYRYYPQSNPAYYPGNSGGEPGPRDYTSSSSTSAYGQERHAAPQRPQGQPGFMSSIMDQFGDEIETLKGAAIAMVGTMLRDMLHKNMPQFADEFERARNERLQQQENSTTFKAASQSYDPLAERAVGDEPETTYQTHNASNYGTSKNAVPSSTLTSSDPISNADRNTTY